MSEKKVLIVDDQSFIRNALEGKLEELNGVEFIEAENGSAALGKVKVSRPDLILLDLVMPTTDGFQVLEQLAAEREQARSRGEDTTPYEVPVIVISSHADDQTMAQVKSLGAREFIDKMQLNSIDLVSLVNRYLTEG